MRSAHILARQLLLRSSAFKASPYLARTLTPTAGPLSGRLAVPARHIHVEHASRAQAAQASVQGDQVTIEVVPSSTDGKVVVHWEDGQSSSL